VTAMLAAISLTLFVIAGTLLCALAILDASTRRQVDAAILERHLRRCLDLDPRFARMPLMAAVHVPLRSRHPVRITVWGRVLGAAVRDAVRDAIALEAAVHAGRRFYLVEHIQVDPAACLDERLGSAADADEAAA
jgi:hypothetical protein